MAHFVKQLFTGEEGATMVEYALVVALIGAALAGVVGVLGGSIGSRFTSTGTTIRGAGGS